MENTLSLNKNQPPIDSIEELLGRLGHRPAKRGKRWICANCGQGKEPALSIEGEVFHCFRCGIKGNLFTLKKELRLLQQRQWTKTEKRLFALRQERIDLKLQRFLGWLNSLRWEYILMFRSALDVERIAIRLGRAMLAKGFPVDSSKLQIVFDAAIEREACSAYLDYLGAKENLRKIYETWRASNAV